MAKLLPLKLLIHLKVGLYEACDKQVQIGVGSDQPAHTFISYLSSAESVNCIFKSGQLMRLPIDTGFYTSGHFM